MKNCPECGSAARPVARVTLKAMLSGDALRRGIPDAPHFCASASCPVVYFGAGAMFIEDDLVVRVHAKHPDDDAIPVCYCFGHSRRTIAREVAETGESTALARVRAEVTARHCACEVKNPKGSCCLGDLRKAELEVNAWLENEKWQNSI